MNLRLVIVEDEPLVRRDLELLLAAEPEVDLVGAFGDGREALERIPALAPDLLLLDVRMPGLDGFALLEALPADAYGGVVFVSAFDEFALRAFEVAAVDYLLKPVDAERLGRALERARERLELRGSGVSADRIRELAQLFESARAGEAVSPRQGSARKLILRETSRIRIVPVETIRWIEADRNYAVLHTGEGRFSLRSSLADLVERLDPRRFVRIHRSTIVAIDQVKELRPGFRGEYRVELKDGTQLRLSRRYRGAVDVLLDETS